MRIRGEEARGRPPPLDAPEEGLDAMSAAALREIVTASFTYVGLLSPDGVVRDVHRSALESAGVAKDRVVGRRLLDLPLWPHSEAERRRVAEGLARAGRGEALRIETTVPMGPDGALAHLDVWLAPIRAESGQVQGIAAAAQDVTARRRTEEALARSEAHLAEAQRIAHLGIWSWDIARDVVTWSDELHRMNGLEPGTFAGSSSAFMARVHPDDVAETTRVYERSLRTGAPFTHDHRMVRDDGTVIMMHTRGEVIADERGRPVRMVGTCWDVTERWRAAQERERLLAAAEEARAQAEHARRELEHILERIADGFVALDRVGRYTYVSRSAGRLLGRSPESLLGKSLWAEFPASRDNPEFVHAFERAAIEQRAVHVRGYYAPWDRWFESRIYPSPDGFSMFFSDVTELHRAEERVRASEEQLRALAVRLDAVREEERRAISREIHDQIGQALTVLRMDLARLASRVRGPRAGVAGRLEQMLALVDETLETARRLSSELRPALLEDLGLAATIEWQCQEFQRRTGISCENVCAGDDARIDADRALALYRILQEALTNVARHAEARSVRVELAIEPAQVVLRVRDDGRGLPPEALERPSSLGLRGMQERARALGGDVTFAAHAGGGTTVSARLPLRPEAARR